MTYYRSINAPDAPVDTKHCLIGRRYNAAVLDKVYAFYDIPPDTVNQYGLIWSSPSRAVNWFHFDPVPGQTGEKLASLDGKLGRLAAHTVVLRPKYPDVIPDLDNLRPPGSRKKKLIWQTPDGAPAGEEPEEGSDYWEQRPATEWEEGATYAPGTVIWHEGRLWTTPAPEGEPGTVDSTWEVFDPPTWDSGTVYEIYSLVEHDGVYYRKIGLGNGEPGVDASWEVVTPAAWDAGTTYSPGAVVEHNGVLYTTPAPVGQPRRVGSNWTPVGVWDPTVDYPAGAVVQHGYPPPTGGPGGPVEPGRFEMGYPVGGDIRQLAYKGMTVDPSTGIIWMVDGNNSYINAAGPDELWGSWGVVEAINPNGHPDELSPVGLSDWGYWELKDATWHDGFMWVIRQLDQHLLKLTVSASILPMVGGDGWFVSGSVSIVDEIAIAAGNPTAVLSDGSRLWTHETGSSDISVLEFDGSLSFVRAAPWGGGDGISGMGWDGGNVWSANPSTKEVHLWDPNTDELLYTRGWDPEHDNPYSVHHAPGDQWLYVVTTRWLHRFPLFLEDKGILRWTGEKWVCQPVYRWTGSAWVRTPIYRLEDGSWVDAEVPCINPHE